MKKENSYSLDGNGNCINVNLFSSFVLAKTVMMNNC